MGAGGGVPRLAEVPGAAGAAELPLADRTDIDVHELADGVVADAACAKRERRIAEGAGLDAGDADVDGFGFHVLRVLGDAGVGGPRAQVVVAFGGPVAADDVDDAVDAAEAGEGRVQHVVLAGIVVGLVLRTLVAE